MSNLYDIVIPPMSRRFISMNRILDKLVAHCQQHNISEDVFLNYRLFPDMLPFSAQIRIATDTVKGSVGRLTDIKIPQFEDNETSVAGLQERIKRLLDFLVTVDQNAFESAESKEIVLTTQLGEYKFKGWSYVHSFVLPQTYFHLTTAYNILRHQGVPLSKLDFLM